ncbi:hypothetical protein WJX74_009412 [Apatococcus lobatus]|uniref:Ubiquitin-like domain-containing protein n=1 Tax=Apatococcus lobatus TaxID=904363 RepID=A0AAW1RAJ7_9CHLO
MQLFVKSTQTHILQLSKDATGRSLRQAVEAKTGLPQGSFWLSFAGRSLADNNSLAACGLSSDSSIQIVHRLLGGKGGFGALLRGAGRAALTDNFDACRDLNGRRLRHVNADRKLADWAAEAKERQLEKLAMKHLREQERERNKAEKAQVNMDGVKAEQSRALAGVMAALNDGFANEAPGNKRKAGSLAEDEAVKKRRFLETLLEGDDSDDSSFDSEDEELAEAAIAQWLSGRSVMSEPTSQDAAGPSSDSDASAQEPQPSLASEMVQQARLEAAADMDAAASQQTFGTCPLPGADTLKATSASASTSGLASQAQQDPADLTADAARGSPAGNDSREPGPVANATPSKAEASQAAEQTQAPAVDLQMYASAQELEQLGLDALKQQLQLHDLKCGGTVEERAARLFLLKDTALADLDKKHFPKGRKQPSIS